MIQYRTTKKIFPMGLCIAFTICLVGLVVSRSGQKTSSHTSFDLVDHFSSVPAFAASSTLTNSVFLPATFNGYPWTSWFGTEPKQQLIPASIILQRAAELQVGWVRLNARISWRQLQPEEGGQIQWDLLTDFEEELQAIRSTGLTPIVIIDDYPRWATINLPYPTSCGAIRADKFNAFASFASALVNRYKTTQFQVHNWEMGNEPDLDPSLVPPDNMFGCWGDKNDPLYGGEHYGEMLKVVSPAIKAADPTANVWIGGLLLPSPEYTDPNLGPQEMFLKGILEAGAAPYFDIVSFHFYPPYMNSRVDYDNAAGGPWMDLGGGVTGKARFLRDLMSEYGVEKPIFLNETGLMCAPVVGGQPAPWCVPPQASFYDMQANFVVRTFVRGIREGLMGMIWFTLDGVSNWNYVGLLEEDNTRKPVYYAYSQLNNQLKNSTYLGLFDYGTSIEAYAFKRAGFHVHVVWAIQDEIHLITIPQSEWIAAYDRDGDLISPTPIGPDYQLQVGFEPIYIKRNP